MTTEAVSSVYAKELFLVEGGRFSIDSEPIRKRILVLNAFRGEFAELYNRALDGIECDVAFITITELPQSIAERAVFVGMVRGNHDGRFETHTAEFSNALRDAMSAVGGTFDHIIGLREFEIEVAAKLREDLGVPGQRLEEIDKFRSKTEMKRVIRSAGLRTPEYAEVSEAHALESLVQRVGFPLVLKQKDGAASIDMFIARSQRELSDILQNKITNPANYEAEEFIQGSVTHINGVIENGVIRYIIPFRYVGIPWEFSNGNQPLGSYSLDEHDPQARKLVDFTRKSVQALGLNNSAFHAEVFERPDGSLCFLELGARVGGGSIAPGIRNVLGRDLFVDDFRLHMGLGVNDRNPHPPHEGLISGDIMFPKPLKPAGQSYRVVRAPSLMNIIPGIYRENIPKVGDIIVGDPHGSVYLDTTGTFLVRGQTQEEVEATIQQIIREYDYKIVPVLDK